MVLLPLQITDQPKVTVGCKIKPLFLIRYVWRIGFANQYVCAIEIMYLNFPCVCTVIWKCFLSMFLIGSQSEVVSPKFLSFIFLLDYLITECIWDRTQNELSLKLLNLSRTVLCIFLQTPSLPFSFRDSVEAASDPGQVLYMYVVSTGTRMV